MKIETKFDVGEKAYVLLRSMPSKDWMLITRKVKILRIIIDAPLDIKYKTEYSYTSIDSIKRESVNKRYLNTDSEQDLFRTKKEARAECKRRNENLTPPTKAR